MDEMRQQKGVVMAELREKGSRNVTVLPLHPLRQIRIIRGSLEEILKQSCEDYVTAVLTDRADLDVSDMQDRIRNAFPNLLEIRREAVRKNDYTKEILPQEELDPFDLCCSFLKLNGEENEEDRDEMELLRDVINTVQGVSQE